MGCGFLAEHLRVHTPKPSLHRTFVVSVSSKLGLISAYNGREISMLRGVATEAVCAGIGVGHFVLLSQDGHESLNVSHLPKLQQQSARVIQVSQVANEAQVP